MREHPYRTAPMIETLETREHEPALELLPMENVVVGAVLVASGALGLLLGLARPDCTLEAGFGMLLFLLGLATLLDPRRS